MDLLTVDKLKIDTFLRNNVRTLVDSEFYFSVDNNQDDISNFDDEHLKVLVCFLSPGRNRAVSNTFNALNHLVHEGIGDKAFVDCCYLPMEENMSVLESNGIPYLFGNTSHSPVTSYDVVMISDAIIPECLNIPHILSKSGIPLTIQERDKDNRIPLIFYGGAAANESALVLGEIFDKGKSIGKSLVDICNYGYGEKMVPVYIKYLYDLKCSGLDIKNKPVVKERMISDKLLYGKLFYPEKYNWVYKEDRFTIDRIECLDSRLPERVEYNKIHDSDFKGFPLKTFNLNGENSDSHDIQISSGCSGQSSTCSFQTPGNTLVPTEDGLVKIKFLVGKRFKTEKFLKEDEDANCTDVVQLPDDKVVEIRMSDGQLRETGIHHRMMKINWETFDETVVFSEDLKVGDSLLIKLGVDHFGDYKVVNGICIDEDIALALGFIQGDGYFGKGYNISDSDIRKVIKVYMKGKEVDVIAPILERMFGKSNLRTFCVCKDGTEIKEYAKAGEQETSILRSLGIGRGSENRVPDVIFKSPKSVIKSYLKGVFQADGWSISSKYKQDNGGICLTSVSIKHLRDIQILLRMLGIFSKVSERTVEYQEDNRKCAQYIHMDTEWANKFKRDVGFIDTPEEEYPYKDIRNIPAGTLRGLVKKYRNLIPDDKIRRVDDHLSFGSISLQTLKIIYQAGIPLPRIYQAIAEERYYPVTVSSVEVTDRVEKMYTTNVEPYHKMCYDMVYEHNCMEATVSGYYRERELEDIVKDMEYVIRTSAPNTISYYSYNLNYYKHFLSLLAEGANHFKGTTLLNERMDVVAHSPDQLSLAKRLGLKRFSGAIEGCGERIRNQIFNKNLSRETLMQACRVIYSLKLMHMKNGMILSGQETEEDIKEFESEVDEMLRIRDEMGANTSLQFNFTPLVLYSQIPLRYLPRNTAIASYKRERTMGDFIDFCRERSIRCKFNGRGCGTWLEQLILDYGPAGTNWLVDVTLNEGLMYMRNFGDKDQERVERSLKKDNRDPLFFTFERPLDWIFPNDHIKYAEPELIAQWKERTKALRFDKQLCLRTPANLSPKCHRCGLCKSKDDILKMVRRELSDNVTLDEVIESFSMNRHVESVRVVVKMRPEWFFYSRESLTHYLTAQFLKRDEDLANAFYAVGKNSTSWVSNNGQKCYFGGTFAFDIDMKERVSVSKFIELIPEINESLRSCKIITVYPETRALPIKIQSEVSYIGKTSKYSMSQIKDKLANFSWDIKTAVKSMGGGLELESKHMPDLKDRILFVPNGSDIMIYMSLPANVNPYLVMSSIIGKGYDKCLADFEFNIIDQGIKTDSTCKCGKTLTFSLIQNKNKSRCQVCEGKILLAKMVGKI